MNYKTAKKIQRFFPDYDPEDPDENWIDVISEAFIDIFITFNIQFNFILKDIESWSKVMHKLAKDSVFRVFDQLGKEPTTKLTKELMNIINCFLKGSSETNKSKKLNPEGRTIKTRKKIYTSKDLIEKPSIQY